ncbi:MAG: FHA domain-containing protein [Bifidobacteriaceae bacterium]|nr:FHA domain-containing protein [Bifidobacteriaceae bacterium]
MARLVRAACGCRLEVLPGFCVLHGSWQSRPWGSSRGSIEETSPLAAMVEPIAPDEASLPIPTPPDARLAAVFEDTQSGRRTNRYRRPTPSFPAPDAAPTAAAEGSVPDAILSLPDGRVTRFPQGVEVILGRESEHAGVAALLSPQDTVSRIHARVYVADGQALIRDAESTNGTWIDGEAITTPAHLPLPLTFGLGRELYVTLSEAPI